MKPILLLSAALAALAPVTYAQDEAAPRAATSLLDAKSGAVVSVKFVLKMQLSMMGQSRDEESNREVRGVLVDPSGLVMLANSHLEGGLPPGFRRMMAQVDFKSATKDFKVLFGSEADEHAAQLVARDSSLGLAFVQILDLKGREVEAVTFDEEATTSIGERLYAVSRLSRGFDCAPAVGPVYVAAKIEKPRSMWAVNSAIDAVGLPIYTPAGAALGVLAMQEGAQGAQGGEHGMLFGQTPDVQTVLLPAKAVNRAVKGAAKRGAEAVAKAKGGDTEADAAEGGEAEPPEGEGGEPTESGDG